MKPETRGSKQRPVSIAQLQTRLLVWVGEGLLTDRIGVKECNRDTDDGLEHAVVQHHRRVCAQKEVVYAAQQRDHKQAAHQDPAPQFQSTPSTLQYPYTKSSFIFSLIAVEANLYLSGIRIIGILLK